MNNRACAQECDEQRGVKGVDGGEEGRREGANENDKRHREAIESRQ